MLHKQNNSKISLKDPVQTPENFWAYQGWFSKLDCQKYLEIGARVLILAFYFMALFLGNIVIYPGVQYANFENLVPRHALTIFWPFWRINFRRRRLRVLHRVLSSSLTMDNFFFCLQTNCWKWFLNCFAYTTWRSSFICHTKQEASQTWKLSIVHWSDRCKISHIRVYHPTQFWKKKSTSAMWYNPNSVISPNQSFSSENAALFPDDPADVPGIPVTLSGAWIKLINHRTNARCMLRFEKVHRTF